MRASERRDLNTSTLNSIRFCSTIHWHGYRFSTHFPGNVTWVTRLSPCFSNLNLLSSLSWGCSWKRLNTLPAILLKVDSRCVCQQDSSGYTVYPDGMNRTETEDARLLSPNRQGQSSEGIAFNTIRWTRFNGTWTLICLQRNLEKENWV